MASHRCTASGAGIRIEPVPGGDRLDDEMMPARALELIEAAPATPLETPRNRRDFSVEEVWEESARYLAFRVRVDRRFRREYTVPGQYVTLSPEHFEPRFLVIANAPVPGQSDQTASDRTEWEFLVDRHTELGRSMDPVESGTNLELSLPEGPGYPIEEAAGRDLLCFVTGSGIASIRPTIQFWNRHPEASPKSIHIYYGESHSDDFAYVDESDTWAEAGVEMFRCASEEHRAADEFEYVQDAFEARAPNLDDAVVFIAGAKVMKRAVLGRLIDRSFPLDRIVTNV